MPLTCLLFLFFFLHYDAKYANKHLGTCLFSNSRNIVASSLLNRLLLPRHMLTNMSSTLCNFCNGSLLSLSPRLKSLGIQYSIIAAAVFSSSAGIVSRRSILSRPEPQPTNAMLIKCTTPAQTTNLKEEQCNEKIQRLNFKYTSRNLNNFLYFIFSTLWLL